MTVDTGVAGEIHNLGHNLQATIADLEKKMREAASNLEFEEAARMRDEIRRLEALDLGVSEPGQVRARSTGGMAGRVTGQGFGGKNVGRPSRGSSGKPKGARGGNRPKR